MELSDTLIAEKKQPPVAGVIMEGRDHGKYSYPGMYVSLKLTFPGYTGVRSLNPLLRDWKPSSSNQASTIIKKDAGYGDRQAYILTLRQFIDFLQHLKSGKPVYNWRGSKMPSGEARRIFEGIVKNPGGAEYLDGKFTQHDGVMQITYNKIRSDGTLEEITEPLQSYLTKSRRQKINTIGLDELLNSSTYQGLPTKEVLWIPTPTEDCIKYIPPEDGRAVVFGSGSNGIASLNCSRSPSLAGDPVGVRLAYLIR